MENLPSLASSSDTSINAILNHNGNLIFDLGDLSSSDPDDILPNIRIPTQRKISLTSELIADSSPIRNALFRHTHYNENRDSDMCDDAPGEGQPKVVIENYLNENYGTSESHEMATIQDVDDALRKESEHMISIRKLEIVEPSGEDANILGGILDVVNLLAFRMSALEMQIISLKGKLQKTVCTTGKRYGKVRLPVIVSNYAKNTNNSGDDHDAVRREREREHILGSTSLEEERFREAREIREFRMNRFFFKKTLETETLNQRPVRHFMLPELPINLTRATV